MDINFSDIQAFGSLAPQKADIYHVDWRVNNAEASEDSKLPSLEIASNYILILERLFAMADRILDFPRPLYCIHFTGGEPAQHPLLQKLCLYLFKSRRNLNICINTFGGLPFEKYLNLFHSAPKWHVCCNIYIQPGNSDLKTILNLAAALANAGSGIKFLIAYEANLGSANAAWFKSLCAFQDIVPFSFQILPMTENDRRFLKTDALVNQYLPKFGAFTERGASQNSHCDYLPDLMRDGEILSLGKQINLPFNFTKDFFWCLGFNYLQIEPNGSFNFGLPECHGQSLKLWQTEKNILATTRIITNKISNYGNKSFINFAPRFRNEADAQTFYETFEIRAKAFYWEIGSRPNFAGKASKSEIFAGRIKRIVAKNFVQIKASDLAEQNLEFCKIKNQAFLAEKLGDLKKIYDALGDENSREQWLEALKAFSQVDPRYLSNSATDNKFTVNGATENWLYFQIENEIQKDLYNSENVSAKLCPNIAIEIPFNAENSLRLLFDAINWLVSHSNRRKLYFFAEHFPNPKFKIFAVNELPNTTAAIYQPPKFMVSFILLASGETKELRKSLESIFIQPEKNFELFVALIGPQFAIPASLQSCTRQNPGKVKIQYIDHVSRLAPQLNICLEMARGEYVAFMHAGDILSIDFLGYVREAMSESQVDAIFFTTRKNGQSSGNAAILDLLACGFSTLMSQCAIFRKSFLYNRQINFPNTQSQTYILFKLEACLHAKTVFFANNGLCFPSSEHSQFFSDAARILFNFPALVLELVTFFQENQLDTLQPALEAFLLSLLTTHRLEIADAISKAEKTNTLSSMISSDALIAIAALKNLLLQIMSDYALLFGKKNNLHPKLARGNFNWREQAKMVRPPKTFVAYENAENPQITSPEISVIMPNYNKLAFVENSVCSILSQSMANFELIIIDDHSIDGSYEILQHYADIDQRIRLYRMDNNVRQGICRNVGIEKALGDYIIFVDSDDICRSDYFELALNAIKMDHTDIVIFSSQYINEDGQLGWTNKLDNKKLKRQDVLMGYFKGDFQPAPWAKIYKKDLIIKAGCQFVEYVFHQDVPFLFSFLTAIDSASTHEEVVYQRILSSDSAIRPASVKYLHLHSAYKYYEYTQKSATMFFGKNLMENITEDILLHTKWNVENVFLEKCLAYLLAIGEIPMTEKDHELLRGASIFVYVLMRGWANIICEMPDEISQWTVKRIDAQPLSAIGTSVITIFLYIDNISIQTRELIDSILNQSMRDFELFIVTANHNVSPFLDALAKSDKRVKISHYNSETNIQFINESLLKANGGYVYFPNCVLSEDLLLHGLYHLEQDPAVDFIQLSGCNDKDPNINNTRLLVRSDLDKIMLNSQIGEYAITDKIFRKDFFLNLQLQEINDQSPYLLAMICGSAKLALKLYVKQYKPIEQIYLIEFYELYNYFGDIKKIIDFLQSRHWDENLQFKYMRNYFSQYIKIALEDYIRVAKQPLLPSRICMPLKGNTLFLKVLLLECCKLRNNSDIQYIKNDNTNAELLPFGPEFSFIPRPLLSIIIYVKDNAQALNSCIESLLEQTGKNVEIIIVDNASQRDNTGSLCFSLQKENKGILCYRANQPMSKASARNSAFGKSSGKYVWFMDCESIPAPNFILTALDQLDSSFDCELLEFAIIDEYVMQQPPLQPAERASASAHGQGMFNHRPDQTYLKYPFTANQIYASEFLREHGLALQNEDILDELFELLVLEKCVKSLINPSLRINYMGSEKPEAIDNVNLLDICECLRKFEACSEKFAHDEEYKNALKCMASAFYNGQLQKILATLGPLERIMGTSPLKGNILMQLSSSQQFIECALSEYIKLLSIDEAIEM